MRSRRVVPQVLLVVWAWSGQRGRGRQPAGRTHQIAFLPWPSQRLSPRGLAVGVVEEGNRVRIACDWLLDGVLARQAVQLGLVRAAAVPLGVARPKARQGPIPSRLLEVGGSP